jgi:hypothetical protein
VISKFREKPLKFLLFIRPFVTASDESGWDDIAVGSFDPFLLPLGRSLSGHLSSVFIACRW